MGSSSRAFVFLCFQSEGRAVRKGEIPDQIER